MTKAINKLQSKISDRLDHLGCFSSEDYQNLKVMHEVIGKLMNQASKTRKSLMLARRDLDTLNRKYNFELEALRAKLEAKI